jgi:hypothetical protein
MNVTRPMQVPPIPPAIIYTIAIGGSMNPAIHHPIWYRTIGAIDEVEYQASIRSPFNTTTQLMSQLRFVNSKLAVQCQINEWMIQGFDDDSWPRMVNIVSLVFEKLNETPVTAYSFITQKHLDTPISDIRSALAEKIYGMKLALPHGDEPASNIELTVTIADHQVRMALQPSIRGADKLFVFYQHQYAPPQEQGKYFDLGKLITARVEAFCEAQRTHCQKVIAALSEHRDG